MIRTGESVHLAIHQTSATTAVMIVGTPEVEVWWMVLGDLNSPVPVQWYKSRLPRELTEGSDNAIGLT